MSVDRDEIRARVAEALRRALAAPKADDATGSAGRGPGRPLVTEKEVLAARQAGRPLFLDPGALITPLAADAIARHAIEVRESPRGGGVGALELPPAKASAPVEARKDVVAAAPPDPGACSKGKVAIAADHGGYEMKQALIRFLEQEAKIPCLDLGCHGPDPVDYPDFALAVARKVAARECCRGIVIDGAGIGSAIAANKIKGIRAAHCGNPVEARNAREHNDANVLTLGGRMIGIELAKAISVVFLKTDFAGGRHQGRIDKITRLET